MLVITSLKLRNNNVDFVPYSMLHQLHFLPRRKEKSLLDKKKVQNISEYIDNQKFNSNFHCLFLVTCDRHVSLVADLGRYFFLGGGCG